MANRKFSDETRIFLFTAFNEISRPLRDEHLKSRVNLTAMAWHLGSAMGSLVSGDDDKFTAEIGEFKQAAREAMSPSASAIVAYMKSAQTAAFSTMPEKVRAELGPLANGII